jgi:hypothetical protein
VILGATVGTRVHAPEATRVAYLSAYTAGADLLHLPVRRTADGQIVVAADATVARQTGAPGAIAELTLAQLRALDWGATYRDASGAAYAYPARIESFALLVDHLPGHLPDRPALLVDLLDGQADTVARVIAALRHRGRTAQAVLAVHDEATLAAARGHGIAIAWAGKLAAGSAWPGGATGTIDAVIAPIEAALDPAGAATPLGQELAERHAGGSLPRGAVLVAAGALVPAQIAAAAGQAWVHAVCADSILELAALLEPAALRRPGWEWIREPFAGKAAQKADVNAELWHLGYAKHNPACHVYVDDGVQVAIQPFTGEVGYTPTGDAAADQLEAVRERTWEALRDWPFYAGGGVGFSVGIDGDFAAEVDVESAVACQATTVEMAAVNVDPAPHRKPWLADGSANLTTSFRDKHTFFDPHGAPPYVGVEHDEDDGYRINWNLGTDYDANQYGRAVGDGKLLRARLRLERRGEYWSAWARRLDRGGPRDWVCVGAVQNESLNPRVYLRCAGKRWRQENPARPTEWLPVVANHFSFRDLTIVRFTETP